jgi:hypothetical protein
MASIKLCENMNKCPMCGKGLETSPSLLGGARERVRLLRAGLTGKDIEKLYLVLNGFNIVGPVLCEFP